MSRQVESLAAFFAPRALAVVGASRDPSRVGAKILRNILTCGYRGEVYPINPQASEVQGLKCFPELSALPGPVDLAIIAVPAPKVEAVLSECHERLVKAAVVISAGFAEASLEGRMRQDTLRHLATRSGIRLLGPNCLGFINTSHDVSLNATFAPHRVLAGNVAVATQSGALGLLLLDFLANRNIGLSSFFSIGNRADVSSNDLLEYWEQDERTDVVALYLESLGNPEKFCEIARRVSQNKPIVALKSGRSPSGKRAAASHSAAVAGEARAVSALFKKAGIIEAKSAEELLDIITFLRSSLLPDGPRVGIVTNGGGPAIMLADALNDCGMEVPELPLSTQESLGAFLPENAVTTNPVDMLPGASVADYDAAVQLVAECDAIDSIAVMHIPLESDSASKLRREMPQIVSRVTTPKPVISVIMSSDSPGENEAAAAIPNFCLPENAAVVLSGAYRYSHWKQHEGEKPYIFDPSKAKELRSLCLHAQEHRTPSGWLPYSINERLLQAAGITLPKAVISADEGALSAAAKLQYPLVAKLVSPHVIHKEDIGGVLRGIQSPEDLQQAIRSLGKAAAATDGHQSEYLIQEQKLNAVEGFVGGIHDKECGPVVVFGAGGKFVQLQDDIAALIPPVGYHEVRNSLSSLRFQAILSGFRGAPATDAEAFIDIILRVAALLHAVPEIAELDLNPVMVASKGASAVDVRIRLYPDKHIL